VGERTIRLDLEYDGAHFAGWQIQPGLRTVQGALKEGLSTICRHDVTVLGAGRTDAGVHARGQVASFRTTSDVEVERIQGGITGLCRPGVVATAVREVEHAFHPLRDARGKVYVYRLLLRRTPSPLLEGRAWHVPWPIDRALLAAELASLPGTADWSAYRAADCGSRSPVKTLVRAELVPGPGEVLELVFEGSGFLKQMVRTLVGTAVDVARGRLPAGSMVTIRDGRDRTAAGRTAPACGLCLERVLY
jgi:tRNA pseudouridine38-40 synthase